MSQSDRPDFEFDARRQALLEALLEEEGLADESTPPQSIRPRPEGRPAPLSFPQLRLWFLDQFDPGNPAYNIVALARFDGPLHSPMLEASLNEVIRRHEALRTTIAAVDGEPVQMVAPAEPHRLPLIDLSAEPDPEAEIRRLVEREAQTPFNLMEGPLLRAMLLQSSRQEHTLLVTMHHMVSDGWSMDLFFSELTQLYGALARGMPSPLPELPIQYGDFAAWQRERLQGEELARQLDYWKDRLAGAPAALELPTDRPRPAELSPRGASRSFVLSAELTAKLKALGLKEGTTLFMTLMAAFQTLLFRYTGQTDILVGTPIANRNRPEMERLIGYFANTVVIRSDLSDTPSFRALLKRVRETALDAFAHQDLPFEKVVEVLQPERNLSRAPLFQVMFILQSAAVQSGAVADLRFQRLGVDSFTAKFDLTLQMMETEQGLAGRWDYSTDLFDPTTIDRMSAHLQRLLEAAAANPDESVARLPLVGESEQRLLLTEWNETGRPFPRDKCIHELIEAQAERTPDAVACAFRGKELTYRELNRRANQLAHLLRKAGVGPDVLVGLCLKRSLEMMVGLLGILKAGGAYVPMDPAYPRERIAYLLADSQPAVLLTQQPLAGQLPEHGGKTICLDTDWPQIAAEPGENLSSGATPENLCYVIYTSGSTGKPKGVMVCHRNVVNFFAGMDQRIGCGEADTLLAGTSISFDISVLELFWTLARGARVVLLSESAVTGGAEKSPARKTGMGMDFSLFYFANAGSTNQEQYRLLLEGARFADRHGFTAVWTPERHFHEFGGIYPNPSVIGAALAMVTERIQIRAGSVVLPLHHPIRVAEEWSVVDNLSRGRVGIAVASGWHADDFVFAPQNYRSRKQVLHESLQTLHKLWQREAVPGTGGAGNELQVRLFPAPVQPKLPVWITTGGNAETFAYAGQIGAHVLTHLLGQDIADLAAKIAVYRENLARHGHDPAAGKVSLMLHTFVGTDREAVLQRIRKPFMNYLRTSIGLFENLFRSLNIKISDVQNMSEQDMNDLLSVAFDRYTRTAALFGTPEGLLDLVGELKQIGVDEIACLVDFGVETDAVLENLQWLDALRGLCNAGSREAEEMESSLAAEARACQPTMLQCTPSLARILMADPAALASLQSLRVWMLGGEAFPTDLAAQVRNAVPARIVNMYGPTETAIWSATYEVEALSGSVVPIGRPIANTEIYLLDELGQPVPIGVPGELYIGGEGVTHGYLRRPELTAERFVPDPFGRRTNGRLYRTGDLARYRPDGTIEFLGRVDDQVKLRGYRIELGEIAAVLNRHAAVRESVAAVAGAGGGEQQLVAYLVLEPGQAQPSADELRGYLKTQLPEYMVPAAFVVLDALPLTPNGKINRRALPPPAQQQLVGQTPYEAPRTPVEAVIARIWAEVLDREQVGIRHNFFDLGGHSLMATLVVSRMRQVFSAEIPLRLLFTAPTVAEFAAELLQNPETRERVLETARRFLQARPGSGEQAGPAPGGIRRRNLPTGPLTAQQQLWFLDELGDPGGPHNGVFGAYRLFGRLDASALERAFGLLVARHETLRSTVKQLDGERVQVVSQPGAFLLPVTDLSAWAPDQREERAQQVLEAESHLPFDLAGGPLFRALLLRLSDTEHILFLAIHHVVFDGWSAGVLLRELGVLYEGVLLGKPVALEELSVHYVDYAHWQHEWLQSRAYQEHLDYWRQELAGAPALLRLPTDRPRPQVQTFAGSRHHFSLPGPLVSRCRALAQRERATLYMALLATYQILLHGYSGQSDILVGTPAANRIDPEVERLIGFFANTLVMRTRLSGAMTFRQVLHQVRETTLGAYAHQEVPFSNLVDALQVERSASHTPLIQTLFILQNQWSGTETLPGLNLRPVELGRKTAKMDLTMELAEAGEAITGQLEYNTDLFDEETVERVAVHFQTLLRHVSENPDLTVGQLAALVGGHSATAQAD